MSKRSRIGDFGLRIAVVGFLTVAACYGLGVADTATRSVGLGGTTTASTPAKPTTRPISGVPAEQFQIDLAELSKAPHRLAGSPEGLAAGRYVEQRLRDMGISEIYPQEFPVAWCQPTQCVLEVDGQSVPIHPLRPNALLAPTTPAEGITGITAYGGSGELAEYVGSPLGGIAVLEFDCGKRWLNAFGLGAKAVLFIGSDRPADQVMQHLNFPANLARFYITAEQAEAIQLRTRRRVMTIKSAAQWEMRTGRNVVAIIRGTDPAFAASDSSGPESVVLAAPLDSYSEVPQLAPGARLAANVAGLLATAEQLVKNPPRRTIVLAFMDGDAEFHAGARAFYGALFRKDLCRVGDFDARLANLASEQDFNRDLLAVLSQSDVFAPATRNLPRYERTLTALEQQARAMAGVPRDELQLLRIARRDLANEQRDLNGQTQAGAKASATQPSTEPAGQGRLGQVEQQVARVDARIADLIEQSKRWGHVERLINDRKPNPDVADLLDAVRVETRRIYELRQRELTQLVEQARQGQAIAAALGSYRTLLHLSFNVSDASSRWAFIHGDDTYDGGTGAGGLGSYLKMLQAVKTVQKHVPSPLLEMRSIDGPAVNRNSARMYAPGLFAHSGAAAGDCGVPNLALMTPMDRRVRDGQPCDVVSRRAADGRVEPVLNVANMSAALRDMIPFVRAVLDERDLTFSRPLTPSVHYVESVFDADTGRHSGPAVWTLSAASAMSDQPARGGMVALMRRGGTPDVFNGDRVDANAPGFVSYPVTQVNASGRYELPPMAASRYYSVLGCLFNSRGLPEYISTGTSAAVLYPLRSSSNILFRAAGMTVVGMAGDRGAVWTKVLKAASTAELSSNDSMVAEIDQVLTVYVPLRVDLIKLFNADGIVALGNRSGDAAQAVLGRGIEVNPFAHVPTADTTSHDLYVLNDHRLGILKDNRILEPSLEKLHSQAQELRDSAGKVGSDNVGTRAPTLSGAAAVSRRVYTPLLSVENDLVVAVVLLLLLTIPFAFAAERLLVGTPHIYRQIGWFVIFFLATFVVLYLVNPAFRIASTPVVIFLAFAIILLSALVIVIMTSKLQSEMRRMQGLASSVHASDVSRLGTMMAAVKMGISTMRRRPIRTLLTSVTVILLTFTILTFASFSSSWGNRKTYIHPLSGPPRVMVRHPLWSRISAQTLDTLSGLIGADAQVVPEYWVGLTASEVQDHLAASKTKEYLLASADGAQVATVAAMVGLDLRSAQKLPELAEILQGDAGALATDGVFLTPTLAKALGVKPGDALNVDGVACRLAGHLDPLKLTAYRMLEGSSMLPVDYQTSGGGSAQALKDQEAVAVAEIGEAESAQFVVFDADQVAVVSASLARRMGGRISSISIFPAAGTDVEQLADRVATVTGLPTYQGVQGEVHRLFFSSLTSASGWKDLVIPVILGGLIIFATMLGSVSDREKEIYAFSALGLAPPHVASLFFAEAGVYAVVGGMGGYLLGQLVARGMTGVSDLLARMGVNLSMPTMNYSSTNAIVTILIVMGTVLISTIYPAIKASRSANPGIQRSWRIGKPDGDLYDLVFPFTVSAYDITGVVSFLREHFENHSDSSMGVFATLEVELFRQSGGMLGLRSRVALAPFDLGVSQDFALMARPSEIEGIDEIRILVHRLSGTASDWRRGNRVFIGELRKQLLIWRALSPEVMDRYRQATIEQLQRLPVRDISAQSFATGEVGAEVVA